MKKIKHIFYELAHETEKAYLFEDFQGEMHWIPKALCDILKEKRGDTQACIASFKYAELTGENPQELTTQIEIGGSPEALGFTDAFTKEIDWGIRKPDKHQKEGVLHSLALKYSFLWLEQGTGKTKVYATVAVNRLLAGLVENIIIVCPVNIKKQWATELLEDFPNIDMKKVKIYGIETHSHDTAYYKIKNELKNIDIPKSHLILDESHQIRHIRTNKTQRIIELFYPCKYKIVGTGTPIGKNAGDLYSQFYILNKKITGFDSFSSFETAHLLYGGRDGEEVVGYREIEKFAKRISPYIFKRTKEQVFELPPKKIHEVFYNPSFEIAEKNKVLEDKLLEYGKEANFNMVMKTITDMQTLLSDDENRDKAFLDLTGKIPENEKIIVWYKYDKELNKIKRLLKTDYSVLHGKISKKQKEIEKEKFRNVNRFLIVNQRVGGTGLNLQFCKNNIYYSMNFSHIDRVQSEDRTHRRGQLISPEYYILIANSTIDKRIADVLYGKRKVSEFLKQKIED